MDSLLPSPSQEFEPESLTADSLMMFQMFVHPHTTGSITSNDDKLPAVPASAPAAPRPAIPDALPESNCYTSPWVEDMVHVDPDGDGKVFLDIGCNTGIDAVMWLERWGKTPGVGRLWDDALKKYDIVDPKTGCGHSWSTSDDMIVPYGHRVASLHQTSSNVSHTHTPHGEPKVVCVEPVPSTVKMLHELTAKVFDKASPFKVFQAAVSDQVGFVNVTDAKLGDEEAGIDKKATRLSGTKHLVSVPLITVDQLLADYGLKTVDVMTIDTEGHDPSVIKGAETALRNGMVRLLIFEIHQDLKETPWATTSLHSVLQTLASWQYVCYWTDNHGPLHRLSGFWTAEMESKFHPVGWGNVACARKTDAWHAILKKYDVGF